MTNLECKIAADKTNATAVTITSIRARAAPEGAREEMNESSARGTAARRAGNETEEERRRN